MERPWSSFRKGRQLGHVSRSEWLKRCLTKKKGKSFVFFLRDEGPLHSFLFWYWKIRIPMAQKTGSEPATNSIGTKWFRGFGSIDRIDKMQPNVKCRILLRTKVILICDAGLKAVLWIRIRMDLLWFCSPGSGRKRKKIDQNLQKNLNYSAAKRLLFLPTVRRYV